MARTTYLSTVILNINGLKGQSKDVGWLNGSKNQNPYISCLQETRVRSEYTD